MNKLKIGDCIVFNEEHPCKVTKINKSAPGKHGSAKYSIFGKSLLTSKTHSAVYGHHDKPSYVTTMRENYLGYYVDSENYCELTLDDESGDKTMDMKLNDEFVKLAKAYEDGFVVEVTTLKYLKKGKETIDYFASKISKIED